MNAAETVVKPADASAIAEAARVLRNGGLVAFPTETVYGLGADATNGEAVARIFAAKGRPRFNPLIVHTTSASDAERLGDFPPLALALASAFWPGPLSLVVPRSRGCPISLLASAGLDTVALRVPAHPVVRALLDACSLPIAAPSANPSGRITATTAAHVAAELGSRVDLILDGGAAPLGIESTVVGFDRNEAVLLRPGAVSRDEIERVTGPLHRFASGAVRSPGQLASHYAPRARLRLDAHVVRDDECLLAFGRIGKRSGPTRNLSPRADLREAAANLFSMLRELDATGAETIAVMPIPHHGLGEAINDRLARATVAPQETA